MNLNLREGPLCKQAWLWLQIPFSKKFESNGRRHTQPQNEEHNNSISDTAVEIEGFAESKSTQCTAHARVTCKPPTKSDTRTSTTPIGPQCSTRNRHTSVNHTVVAPESSSERSQINTEPCRNFENVTLHQVASHPLPQLGKRVNKCPGVPQVYRDRLATFQGVSLPQPADILAANGFYYVGRSGAVKCAYCGEVWHVNDSRQTSVTVHTPACKFHSTQEVAESCEASSQPNSLSDNDVSSVPAVQEVKKIGFHTSDIVNAYREMASRTLDIRVITQSEILRYFFEDDNEYGIPAENETGCTCCNCSREVISEMYLPCRHGCCHDCKSRVLLHCPKCDAIIKSKIDIYT